MCFRSIQNLPIQYKANKNAWMTKVIFNEWLLKWDNALMREKRKIYLLIDNCSCHSLELDPKCIKLLFLPTNTTSILQPLNQGIIHAFKLGYRTRITEKLLLLFDKDEDTDKFEQFLKNFSLLDCAFEVKNSWNQVSSDAIYNIFAKILQNRFTNTEIDLIEETTIDDETIAREPDTLNVDDIVFYESR